MRRGIHWGAAFLAAAAVSTMTVSEAPAETRHGTGADIRYTEYGVPHITADDFTGLGYGFGFAAATDNVCQIAKVYLTVNAQRSRHLGADTRSDFDYGPAASNLDSDLYFQQINDSRVIEHLVAQPAPVGPRRESRELIRGYVAGYNRYLRQVGVTDPSCRGADWVRPITERDVYRHFYAVATYAGAGQAIDGIANAAPPAVPTVSPAIPPDASDRVRAALDGMDMGSNAIAVGSAGTASGRGLLLGNPHFPWQGGRRFWQSQMTVPGRLNVSGAGLLGLPFVQIGFNADVAWSHTVSTATTFGLYELKLVPGDPTSYLVDGRAERMTSRRVRVQTQTGTVERTLYASRYGPVVSPMFGLPLNWSSTTAYAFRDANRDNMRGLNTWFELGRSHSTRDIVNVLSRTQGVPWVNTIATDRAGHALYADIQVVPNVTDELAARCNTPLGQRLFGAQGIPVLDGSRRDCAWGTDPDAVVPGIFGARRLPVRDRTDYVANANDSAWLSNPHQPLTGYPRIVGDIATPRAPRTRMAITAVEEGLGEFTRKSMQDLLFADQSWSGGQAAAAAAAMCAAFPDGRRHRARRHRVRRAVHLGPDDDREQPRRPAVRAVLDEGGRPGEPVAGAVRPGEAGRHAEHAQHGEPGGGAGTRRRHRRPPRRRHRARRPAGRAPLRRQERHPHPDPRRAGLTGRAERDPAGLGPGRGRRGGRPRQQPHPGGVVRRRPMPGRVDTPDVLAVEQPGLPALRRPDHGLLDERLGPLPLLRTRHPVLPSPEGNPPPLTTPASPAFRHSESRVQT
jgi:acyl-homoserine-lactone acylase